jgi:hypothetical protein
MESGRKLGWSQGVGARATRWRRAGLAFSLTAGASVVFAQVLMQPGLYETTIELNLPGAPGAVKTTQCFTPDQAGDMHAHLMEAMGAVEDCTTSNVQTQGDAISWDTTCEDMTVRSEVMVRTDGFDAIVHTTIGGSVMTSRMTSRRIGATCTAEE